MTAPTLSDTIESFCRALGVRSWEYMPAPFRVRANFECSLCRKRWSAEIPADLTSRTEVQRADHIARALIDSYDEHDAEGCQLELGYVR